MAKLPDDNDRAQLGALGGYLDDAAPWDVPPPPASGTVPRLLSAREGAKAIRAALLSPAPLVLLRSTPGAGKSAESHRAIESLTREKRSVAVVVPTHSLGEQTEGALNKLRVDTSRPVGVARVRLPMVSGEGAHACVHHEAAELAALAGVRVREEVCVECPHMDNYQGKEEAKCPAYEQGAEKADVMVLQQPLLARTLAAATLRLRAPAPEGSKSKTPPPPSFVFVDELPALVDHALLEGARSQWARERLSGELRPNVREILEPAMLAMLRGAEEGREGLSLRGILALSGSSEEVVERELAELRDLDNASLWRDNLPGRLACRSLDPATRDHAVSRLAAVARFTKILEALVDAAHEPDRPALRIDAGGAAYLTTAARWTRRIRPYLDEGGRVRLLDATAPVDALRALFGDLLEVVAVEVEDAPGVERRFRVWQHGARSRHTSAGLPVAEQIRGPLRWLAERLQERGARSVGLLTHKPLADALRGWLLDRKADPSKPAPAWCPDELAELVAAGLKILPGHYGAQRGLNTWAGCDVLATLGDPWPNLGAARAEALALGLDSPEAWALEQTRAELLQAWGRARTVHRASPVLVVHLGSLALAPEASWAPQWANVRAEKASRGRPPTTLPLSDPATWAEERARLGLSARAHAAALGLSWGTYCRKEPKRTIEEASGGAGHPENTGKEVAHKWSPEVSGVSEGTPSALLSVPIYGPPPPELVSNSSPSTDPLRPPPAQTEARGSATGATRAPVVALGP